MNDTDLEVTDVVISKEEYERLKECDLLLSYLYGAGVDNWEHYEIALEMFQSRKPGDQ